MIMIANPIDEGKRWQDFCRDVGQQRTDSSDRGAAYPQFITDQSVITAQLLGFVEGFVCFSDGFVNLLIYQWCNADTDGHIGRHAFIKHVRNFKIVDLLANSLGSSLCLRWIDSGQQHHKLLSLIHISEPTRP